MIVLTHSRTKLGTVKFSSKMLAGGCSSTCVDFVLKELKLTLASLVWNQILNLKADLRLDATTAKCVHLGSLLFNLEAALEEIPCGLAVACTDAKGHPPRSLFELFGQEILEAHKYLPKCSNQPCYTPAVDHVLLLEFVDSMKGILKDLKGEETDLVGGVKKEIEALEKKVRSLKCSVLLFANGGTEEDKVRNILTHLGDLAYAAAHLSYICWANKMEKEIVFMISDLQRKSMASAREATRICLAVLEVYPGFLKASNPPVTGASTIVEDVVSSFLNSLLSLDCQFHKIKLVKVEAKRISLLVRGISLFSLPYSDRAGCMYFPLGSPWELLICNADSIACLKSQIEVVQREQEFLRAFLKDGEEQLYEHKKLKGLATGVMHIEYEAEHIIHSLVVRDSPPWCCLSWLFELIERQIVVQMFGKEMLHLWIQCVAQTSKHMISERTTPKTEVASLKDQLGMMINRLRGSLQQNIVNHWHDWLRKYK